MQIKQLDIRDIAIIDALPNYNVDKTIFTVGCGGGRIEYHLNQMGYIVTATDILNDPVYWKPTETLTFKNFNILEDECDEDCSVVICSEVLEHIPDFRLALRNLVKMPNDRLIITVPYKQSFNDPDHKHYWDDDQILEFKKICDPYSVSISKIRTKPRDVEMNQWGFLIIIDKRQKYGYLP